MRLARDHNSVADALARRRAAAAAEWDLADQLVLVVAGQPIHIPGRGDLTYPFRAHSEYFYLTDRNRPGGVLAFDPAEGWFDFVRPVTPEEALWSGAPQEDQEGLPATELEDWLAAREGRPIACLGVPHPDVEPDAELTDRLRYALALVRLPKDAVELERMRVAERATRAGLAAVRPLLEDGRTERDVQIELEAAFLRNGADSLAFETIVAGGPNSGVLHFVPGDRPLRSGELVLIDSGGEYRGYASDITRTYPVGAGFDSQQEELHSLVRAAELAAIERCGPGAEFREVHRAASLVITEGLLDLGVLRGTLDELVERDTVGLFFPHSIGHFVGLGVRDAGNFLPDRRNEEFPRVRIDIQLQPGYALTVEPGIYFVPALLCDSERRERHRDLVDWDRVDGMLDFGGIRIEDNVVVTDGGAEVLTRDVPVLDEPI